MAENSMAECAADFRSLAQGVDNLRASADLIRDRNMTHLYLGTAADDPFMNFIRVQLAALKQLAETLRAQADLRDPPAPVDQPVVD